MQFESSKYTRKDKGKKSVLESIYIWEAEKHTQAVIKVTLF